MKRFVVFDLDGTLLNTIPDIAGAMNRALKRHGLPQHPNDSYKLFTGNGAKVLTQRAVGERTDMWQAVYQDYAQDYAAHSRVDTAPYDGIPQALAELKRMGVHALVYSNKDDADTKDVIRHYFPGYEFLAVLGARAGIPLKPDPTALDALMALHGLKAHNGLYVGDTVMDMRCAHAVGLYAVAVTWGFQTRDMLRAEHPNSMINHPDELVALVRERLIKHA
ncbi:MAG TPA: HAD family hydrolase [Clostridiales bacterium]|jgi:phosphoglycolate phosphatase|nr:HAD family hydrolase [Clostridiales bacterium]